MTAQTTLQIIAGLAVLNVVLSSVAGAVDPKSTAGRILHAILAIAPLDLYKLYKSIAGGAALLVVVVCATGCAANGAPTPTTVQDVTIGLNAAICVIGTYSSDISQGKGEVDAIADCVIKCGVTAAQASGLLDAHRKAETLEQAKKPNAGNDVHDQAVRALVYMRAHPVPAS